MKTHEFFPGSDCEEHVQRAKMVYEKDMGEKPVSSSFLDMMSAEEETDERISTEFRSDVFALRRVAEADPAGVNYYNYGRLLWDHFFWEELREEEPEIYNQFLVDLIRGHIEHIPIEKLVFLDVEIVAEQFIQEIFPKLGRLALWSMGDVRSTGYQTLKIYQSGITKLIQDGVLEVLTNPQTSLEPNEYLHRLGYLVDEEKKKYLFEWLRLIGQDIASEPPTIIVIEDSWKNLEAIEQFIADAGLERLHGKFYPIWAHYSREGDTLRKKDMAQFEEVRRKYNGIGTPEELLSKRFEEAWQGAMVWVDFDGVVVDNRQQRIHQARVKFSAIESAKQALEAKGIVVS